MFTQRAHDVRTLAAAAHTAGATLPDDVVRQADHLANLTMEQHTRPNVLAVAADLAQHLGDASAMTKARKRAATDLAAADAHARLSDPLRERCSTLLHQRIRQAREPIAAAFGEALASHVATLTADAARLPSGFSADQAGNLAPDVFAAWVRARDAHQALESVRIALGPLYPGPDRFLGLDAKAALRFIAPPTTFTDPGHAHAFVDALAGVRRGGSSIGPTADFPVFAPTACANLGATFEWAGPAEVAARVAHVTAGATPIKVDRQGRRMSVS
jgi:hypothetical protein